MLRRSKYSSPFLRARRTSLDPPVWRSHLSRASITSRVLAKDDGAGRVSAHLARVSGKVGAASCAMGRLRPRLRHLMLTPREGRSSDPPGDPRARPTAEDVISAGLGWLELLDRQVRQDGADPGVGR